MKNPRSVFGRPPNEIAEILRPLQDALQKAHRQPVIKGRRREFLHDHVFDALRTGKAIQILIESERMGIGVSADSVEALVRRVVEQAIVSAYVSIAPDAEEIVDRYLRTTAAEWKRSFGREVPESAIDAKGLPSYGRMAEEIGGWLQDDYKKLSYVSHPRGTVPYRFIERHAGVEPHDFFVLRVSASLGRLDTAIAHLVEAFESVDAADPR